MVATNYSLALAAKGGSYPLSWSLRDIPPELQWLTIDPHTGVLGGMPTALVEPGVTFTVTVTDRAQLSDSKLFALAVRNCVEGSKADCYFSRSDACMLGESTCTSGKPGPCTLVNASTSVQHCGAACEVCDAALADNCTNGLCQCGGGTPCLGTTCCAEAGGAVCVNTQDGNTSHCGSCSPCPTFTPTQLTQLNMAGLTCQGGTCKAVCIQPSGVSTQYQQCGALENGCTDTWWDPKNCGSCGTVCANNYCCGGSCIRAC